MAAVDVQSSDGDASPDERLSASFSHCEAAVAASARCSSLRPGECASSQSATAVTAAIVRAWADPCMLTFAA
jgi:hypothetical protein